VHINAHWRIKGVFNNLVKFVYKLVKNWQTRAWDSVLKTAGSAPDAAMILGLFSQEILRLTLIVSYIELFIFIIILCKRCTLKFCIINFKSIYNTHRL
jgi:hypothetical protein